MNIHEYTSREHEYSWLHITLDMNIHDYTLTGDMNIHEWHILIPGFLIVPKSLGGHLPYWKVGLRYKILKAPLK